MDLPWGDEKTVQFITNVRLITTKGRDYNHTNNTWVNFVSSFEVVVFIGALIFSSYFHKKNLLRVIGDHLVTAAVLLNIVPTS
jgi:hypothetical protein